MKKLQNTQMEGLQGGRRWTCLLGIAAIRGSVFIPGVGFIVVGGAGVFALTEC